MSQDAEEYSKIARALCEKNMWRAVLEFAQKWHDENPADSTAHFYLGIAHRELGQFVQADGAYRRALEIEPANANAWNNLAGLLYENLRRPAEGISCIREALKLNPQNKVGWSNLSTMVGRLGRHEEAMQYADRALSLDPDWIKAYLDKGAAALSLGKMDVVRQVCNALEKLGPEKFRRGR